MKKILFIFLTACFFFSCEKETIVIPQQHAGRTVLAFFWADNSLNSNLRNNIRTMMQGLQAMKDSAALLVYWDGEASDISWPEPCIVEYVTNGQGGINSMSKEAVNAMIADQDMSVHDLISIGNIRKKYPPQTSTEKTVMQTVIGDMMSVYPSESYGIIFGSHGSGWLPTITGTRSIGQDGGRYSSDTALIPELAEVLRTVNPQKFDFVLFDACMMGCAEVYYELKDAARYCIASVLDIPAAGFPYASVMPYLYENAIKDYLGPICKDYIDYYNYNGWGTISAVDCNQMEGLAEAVRSVILSNQDSLKNVDTADLQQYGKGSSNFKGYAYDMLQFIEKLCGGMAPDDFTQQLKKTVIYTDYTHDPTSSLYRIDGDNYSGMGMYIPNSFTTPKYLLWNNYFKSSIAWYHASGWAETESIWGN